MAEALISAEQVLVTDYPLNEALNVLKGVNAFRPAAQHHGQLCPGTPCSQRPATERTPYCPILMPAQEVGWRLIQPDLNAPGCHVRFRLADGVFTKWKMLAASTASAAPSSTPSARWSRLPRRLTR